MPLLSIDATQAFQNLQVPAARWPNRGDAGNRIEPVAQPEFKPTFHLEPKEMVFTIGSCFARNVERELEQLGFSVPMRHIQIADDVGSVDNNQQTFNNYGVTSIFNELQWALDPTSPFDPETGLLELAPGQYIDLHLSQLSRAASRDAAMERRRRITQAMATAAKCRIIIVTLGLAEVWWDDVAKRYLNVAPPKQFARRHPNRFYLHVLSYSEVSSYLQQTIELLRRYGYPDHKIILTISPVPLGATFTAQDVAVANTYSKSVLRAAAEEVTRSNGHIDYFPSFESVILSERHSAWSDDMVHVTPKLVALNVARMVAAYAPDSSTPTVEDAESAEREGAEAERRALWLRAAKLYRRALELKPDSAAARLGLARSLGGRGDHSGALQALLPLEEGGIMTAEVLRAKLLIFRLNNLKHEFESLDAPPELLHTVPVLSDMAECAFHFGMFDRVRKYAAELANLERNTAHGLTWAGRAALESARYDDAVRLLRAASEIVRGSPLALFYLGRALMGQGDIAAARVVFDQACEISPSFAPAKRELQRLASLDEIARSGKP